MPPPKKVKAKINANHPILNYGTSILMKDLKILSKNHLFQYQILLLFLSNDRSIMIVIGHSLKYY
jgi:hypothetical protein